MRCTSLICYSIKNKQLLQKLSLYMYLQYSTLYARRSIFHTLTNFGRNNGINYHHPVQEDHRLHSITFRYFQLIQQTTFFLAVLREAPNCRSNFVSERVASMQGVSNGTGLSLRSLSGVISTPRYRSLLLINGRVKTQLT